MRTHCIKNHNLVFELGDEIHQGMLKRDEEGKDLPAIVPEDECPVCKKAKEKSSQS